MQAGGKESSTAQEVVFSGCFVKVFPPDFAKEGNRFKKPPPPFAPVIKPGVGTTERKHEMKKIPPEKLKHFQREQKTKKDQRDIQV